MITVPSSAFLTAMQDNGAIGTIRFTFDSSNYDDYFISASEISRDANLSAGMVNIVLANTDQTWNIFYSDTSNIGKTVEIKLGLAGQHMTLYTGTVERAIYEGATVTLECRDKVTSMLEFSIGDSDTAVEYTSYAWNPSDLVTDILENQLGFSSSDWDTTAFSNWYTHCASNNYALKAKFTGQTARTALLKIAQMTASFLSVNNIGEVDVAPTHPSGDSFTLDNCLKIDLEVTRDEMCNEYNVKYGYDPDDDSWAGTEQAIVGSEGIAFLENNRFVWHDTSSSADTAATYIATRYGTPRKWITLQPSLYGFRTEIGDDITVSETLKGISSASVLVTDILAINLDPDSDEAGTVTLRGYIQ